MMTKAKMHQGSLDIGYDARFIGLNVVILLIRKFEPIDVTGRTADIRRASCQLVQPHWWGLQNREAICSLETPMIVAESSPKELSSRTRLLWPGHGRHQCYHDLLSRISHHRPQHSLIDGLQDYQQALDLILTSDLERVFPWLFASR